MTTPTWRETPFWLRTREGSVAAVATIPALPGRAVLLCYPFFEERKACRLPFVEAARAFAADGAVVLRFDYRGCGESDGPPGVEGWEADLLAADAWLASRYPGLPRAWLAVRAACALAARAASRAADGRGPGLVLWEPVTGDAFLHQAIQRKMVNDMVAYGRAPSGRKSIEALWQQGQAVDLDAYVVPAALAAGLRDLRPAPSTGPALILRTGADERSAAPFCDASPQAAVESLRLPPFWNTVGYVDTAALRDRTAAWLLAAPEAPGGDSDAAMENDAAGPAELAVLPSDRGPLAVTFHPPVQGAPRGAVLFLSGWSGDRAGPHGMFVRLARRLAGNGFACLRLDYAGRGDSGGAAGEATIAGMTGDALVACRWLRERVGNAVPLTLAGICSGCKVAISAAALGQWRGDMPSRAHYERSVGSGAVRRYERSVGSGAVRRYERSVGSGAVRRFSHATGPVPAAEHEGVQRLVLWSAESMGSLRSGVTGWRKTRAALLAYGRKALRRDTWRRLLRGDVQPDLVRKALVRHEARSPEEARAEDRTLEAFRRFPGDILFLFGGSDPDAAGSSAAYARFCGRYGIPFETATIPHAGHSFYGADWEREVLDRTAAWLGVAGDSALPADA